MRKKSRSYFLTHTYMHGHLLRVRERHLPTYAPLLYNHKGKGRSRKRMIIGSVGAEQREAAACPNGSLFLLVRFRYIHSLSPLYSVRQPDFQAFPLRPSGAQAASSLLHPHSLSRPLSPSRLLFHSSALSSRSLSRSSHPP